MKTQPQSLLQLSSVDPNPRKIRPLLPNKARWKYQTLSDLTYITKQHPKMLANIELSCNSCDLYIHKGIKVLCQALKNARRISSLIMKKDAWFDNNTKQLQALVNNTNRWKKLGLCYHQSDDPDIHLPRLKRCRNLSDLDISLQCDQPTKNTILTHLSKQFKSLNKLKTLGLDLKHCPYNPYVNNSFDLKLPRSLSSFHIAITEDHETQTLLLRLKFPNQLETLSLDLSSEDGHPELDPQFFIFFFSKMPNLKYLNISRVFNRDDYHQEVPHLFSSFPLLKKLTSFSLELSRRYPCDRPLKLTDLLPHFQHLIHLKKFHFVYIQELVDSELRSLAHTIQSFSDLKILSLTLPSRKISHEGILCLSEALNKMIHLQDLYLNLDDIDISHESVQAISNNIAHLDLKTLRIAINFSWKKRFESFKNLWKGKAMKRLTPLFSDLYGFNSLRNLHLDISKFDVTTQEFKHFALLLKELKKITSLSLHLPRFDPANNFEGLRVLLSSFKELENLGYLHFNMRGKELCDQQVGIVSLHIREYAKSLEALELCFIEAEKLKDESLLTLFEGIKCLQRLKKLEVIFWRKEGFGNQVVIEVLQGLNVLKDLEAFRFHDSRTVSPLRRHALYRSVELKNFEKMRHLTNFTVNNSRFI